MSRRAVGLWIGAVVTIAVIVTSLFLGSRGLGPDAVALLTVEGEVSRERDGGRVPARVGMHLEPGDRVITGADGEAVIRRGAFPSVTLGPQTQVAVLGVDEGVVELGLERGRVRAKVRPGSSALRLVQGDRAVVATDGAFDAAVDAAGVLQVAGTEGSVTLVGMGEVAQLGEGERAASFPNGEAVRWRASPELLLDVAWPAPVGSPSVRLAGRTEPGAVVKVLDPPTPAVAQAGADGGFEIEVALPEAQTLVRLEVRDAMGGVRQATGTITRKQGAPTFSLDIDYAPRRRR